jgi:hypothetical protein
MGLVGEVTVALRLTPLVRVLAVEAAVAASSYAVATFWSQLAVAVVVQEAKVVAVLETAAAVGKLVAKVEMEMPQVVPQGIKLAQMEQMHNLLSGSVTSLVAVVAVEAASAAAAANCLFKTQFLQVEEAVALASLLVGQSLTGLVLRQETLITH